jgi:uncharacterized protein YoxC
VNILIELLVVLLLFAAIAVSVRFWGLLGTLRNVLMSVEETRGHVQGTLHEVDVTLATANSLLKEQAIPVLNSAHKTFSNLEVSTRALADVTESMRGLSARAESIGRAASVAAAAGSAIATMASARGDKKRGKSAGIVGLVASVTKLLAGSRTRQENTQTK